MIGSCHGDQPALKDACRLYLHRRSGDSKQLRRGEVAKREQRGRMGEQWGSSEGAGRRNGHKRRSKAATTKLARGHVLTWVWGIHMYISHSKSPSNRHSTEALFLALSIATTLPKHTPLPPFRAPLSGLPTRSNQIAQPTYIARFACGALSTI